MAKGLGISKTQISPRCIRDCVPTNQKCRKDNKTTLYELRFEMHKREHNAKEMEARSLVPNTKIRGLVLQLKQYKTDTSVRIIPKDGSKSSIQ